MWLWVAFQLTTFPRTELSLCLRALDFRLWTSRFPHNHSEYIPLSRRPRGTLAALWYQPGTFLYP